MKKQYALYAIPGTQEIHMYVHDQLQPFSVRLWNYVSSPMNGWSYWGSGTFALSDRGNPSSVQWTSEQWLDWLGCFLLEQRFSWTAEELAGGSQVVVFTLTDGEDEDDE